MLSEFNKFPLWAFAAGFFAQDGTTPFIRGCTAIKVATGTWAVTMTQGITVRTYLFTTGLFSGFSPGVIISMTDTDPVSKLIQLKNSNTGAAIDVDFSWLMLATETSITT
jgi:hypothetical protein